MASTRRLTWQRHHWWAWAIEERATQIHRVWTMQDSAVAAAEVKPARRNAVTMKCSCSRESAQVEHARTCILLNDVCVLVSLFSYLCDNCVGL